MNSVTKKHSSCLLKIAVLIDVDGTLAGPYKHGYRKLHPTALSAIKMLAKRTHVFLWSIAGADNGKRLIREFPELKRYITGCYGKDEFPLDTVQQAYCIDDEAMDPQLFKCNYLIVDTYNGGADSGLLLEAAGTIVDHISRHFPCPSLS